MRAARKVRSRSGAYTKIIEISVPVRFYWVEDEYDGLEFGPIPEGTSKHQLSLIFDVLRSSMVLPSMKRAIIEEHLCDREEAVMDVEEMLGL